MGSHQRLQPGMVIRGQRDRACKRHGHSHCPYDERRCHLTGTSPSCYPLSSSQSTGTGFTKWTSSEVDIGAHGVIGDRAYALREANGRVVTAKKWTNMFEFCARYDAPPTPGALVPLSITLPDGRTMHAQDPDASAVLSAVLGRTVV